MNTRHSGFTLVELLIASAIGALIAATALGVMSVGMTSFATVQSSGAAEMERARFVAAISSDARSAMPIGGARFVGARDRMSFARLWSPARTTNSVEAARIEWRAAPEGGMVRTLTRPDGTETIEHFSAIGVVRFGYAGKTSEEGTPAPAEMELLDEWGRKNYPGIVRIRFGAEEMDVSIACSDYAFAGRDAQ